MVDSVESWATTYLKDLKKGPRENLAKIVLRIFETHATIDKVLELRDKEKRFYLGTIKRGEALLKECQQAGIHTRALESSEILDRLKEMAQYVTYPNKKELRERLAGHGVGSKSDFPSDYRSAVLVMSGNMSREHMHSFLIEKSVKNLQQKLAENTDESDQLALNIANAALEAIGLRKYCAQRPSELLRKFRDQYGWGGRPRKPFRKEDIVVLVGAYERILSRLESDLERLHGDAAIDRFVTTLTETLKSLRPKPFRRQQLDKVKSAIKYSTGKNLSHSALAYLLVSFDIPMTTRQIRELSQHHRP